MIKNVLFSSFGNLMLVLLIIAFGIFVWLTAKSRNVKSFQFQISLFIVIGIVGEIVDLIVDEGVIKLFSNELGIYIHVIAMVMFSTMIWIGFYLSKKSGKKLADTLQES